MKLSLVKTQFGTFVPAFDSDHESAKKIGMGEIFEIDYKKVRNPKFHRKFFALIKLVYDNQESFENMNDLRHWLTMKAGFYKEVTTPDGTMFLPESISFSTMDEIKFSELYNRVVDVVIKRFSMTSETIESELIHFY